MKGLTGLALGLVLASCGPAADQIGTGIGKGLETLEMVATLFAVVITGTAWWLFARGRRNPDGSLGPLGVAAILVVHFTPLLVTLTERADPAHDWGLSAQWRSWGGAVAWSAPAVVALLWVLRPRVSGARRAVACGAVVAVYLAIVVALIHARRPVSLAEPLVEIATTIDRQLSCGRTSEGAVVCLGDGHEGEFGDTEPHDLLRPTRIDALSPAMGIFMGERALCVQRSPTMVRCAGRREGVGHVAWEANSSEPFKEVLVGERHLVFVSPTGALEAWSSSGRTSSASASTAPNLCFSHLLFVAANGHGIDHDLATGLAVDLGQVRQVGCYCDSSYCESGGSVILEGRRLTVRNEGKEQTIEVPDDARILPYHRARILLQAGGRHAICDVSRGGTDVDCKWESGAATFFTSRGVAADFSEDDDTSAGKLAAMTRALQR